MIGKDSFNDFSAALRMREIIAKVVREENARQRPPARYGKVHDFNRFTLTCLVLFPGDVEATRAKMHPYLQPTRRILDVGESLADVVRVEGVPGNLWVTGIANGAGFSDQHTLHLPSLRGGAFMHQQVAKFFGGSLGGLPAEGGVWYAGKWVNASSFGAKGLAVLEVVVNQSLFAPSIKKYTLAVRPNETGLTWKKCAPVFASGPWSGNDFELEIKTGDSSIELRVRRTGWNPGGFTPDGYVVDVWFHGEDWERDYSYDEGITTDAEPTRYIGTTSPEAKGPFLSTAMNSPCRAQQVLMGGGAMTYSTAFGSIFSWTKKFIASSMGRNYLSRNGYFDIGVPAGGATVPVYNKTGTTSTTTVAGGVYLENWDALYYEVPWGGANTFDETKFRIVNHSNATANTGFDVPSHWIFVAMKSADSAFPHVKVGTGEIIDIAKNLTLESGFGALGFGWATPAYLSMQGNRTELEGLVSLSANKAAGSVVANIPSHWRPRTPKMFTSRTNTGWARVDVETDGDIVLQTAINSGGWFSLDGISFARGQ